MREVLLRWTIKQPVFLQCCLSGMILLALVGCVSKPTNIEINESFVSGSYVNSRWLSSLDDGKTTRTGLVSVLGQPTEQYADNRILIYRLLLIDQNEVPTSEDYGTALSRWTTVRSDGAAAYRSQEVADLIEKRSRLAESGRLLVVTKDNAAEHFWHLIVREAEFSLVCVLDDHQILSNHRLITIKP